MSNETVTRYQWIFENEKGDRYTPTDIFYTKEEAEESAKICKVKSIGRLSDTPIVFVGLACAHPKPAPDVSALYYKIAELETSNAKLLSIAERGAEFEAQIIKAKAQPAPDVAELVEALEETQRDLTVLLGNICASSKRDKNWEGMYDVVNGWIARNHAALAKRGGES